MNGNPASRPPEPRFLLDESLVPAVAEALALVGYQFDAVTAVFGKKGIKDPEIIEWCQANDAVWVHADDRARRQHKAILQQSGIRTIWVYRKGGRMTGREQLRILAFVLPQLIRTWAEERSDRHWCVSAPNGTNEKAEKAKPILYPVDPETGRRRRSRKRRS